MNWKSKTFQINAHYAAIMAVFWGGFATLRGFMTIFLLARGFDYTAIGFISAAHMLASAVMQLSFARILAKFPKVSLQRFTEISFAAAILCSTALFFVPETFVLYLILFILLSILQIAPNSLINSIGMEYLNAGIPLNFGVGRAFGSIGYAVSSFFVGILIESLGSVMVPAANILFLLLLIVLLLTLRSPANYLEAGKKLIVTDATLYHEAASSLGSFARNNRSFLFFLFATIFLFFGHCIQNNYLPNIVAQFGGGADVVGYMMSFCAIVEILPMICYGMINRKISTAALLIISAIGFTLKSLCVTLAGSVSQLTMALVVQIFGYALYTIASVRFTNDVVADRDRVQAQSLLFAVNEIGFTIGGLTGGVILDHSSIHSLLWITTGVSAFGTLLMIFSILNLRRKTAQTSTVSA